MLKARSQATTLFSLLAATVFGSAVVAQPVETLATGQTTSYATGDDGDVQAGLPWTAGRFTDNGDGTITDSLTGLMWMQDAKCAETAGFEPTGGARGPTGRMAWQESFEFLDALNGSLDVSGCTSTNYSDWRLPNLNELESLADYETWGLYWLGGAGFTNVPTFNDWWSSTSDAASGQSAFLGTGSLSFKANGNHVLPVRGANDGSVQLARTGQTISYWSEDDGDLELGTAWPSPRFVDNGDGTVTDQLTLLVWLKDANCADTAGFDPDSTGTGALDFASGLDFVAGLNDGSIDVSGCGLASGNDGWRHPNWRELRSLIDYSQNQPVLPAGHPFDNAPSASTNRYATSTSYGLLPTTHAIQHPLYSPGTAAFPKTDTFFVWPVKGPITVDDSIFADGFESGGTENWS